MKPIITIKNINFTYNKGRDNEYQALINISLDIYPEEFIVIFGPSGCGKSTLLNVIAGLERPDSGEVAVLDQDLMKMSKNDFAMYHRAQVGMVYQQYNLITSLTVLDNVALPQIFINVGRSKRNQWSKQLLERFGILKQAGRIPTELSGGQQQRIGIARAIVNNPKIVLADEPVGNLDSVSAKNVLEILAELNEKEKKTLIMVTHNPENLILADRIIYMKDGIITREVINKDKHKEIKKKGEGEVPKSPTAEISDLMRAYHGLSPEQINILIMPYKAKVFAHHFITTRNMEETKIFEDVIQRRLLGTISQDEIFDILKRNSHEGGVGFDKRTAEKILRRVNRVIRMAYYVYQKGRQRVNEKGEHEKITDDEKAKKVTEYLLKTIYTNYYKHLDEVQINRIQEAVKERMLGQRQKEGFYKIMDAPFKEGGVGLNSKTAQAITEEIELILILGFGIVQMFSDSNKKEKELLKNRILNDNHLNGAEKNGADNENDEDDEEDNDGDEDENGNEDDAQVNTKANEESGDDTAVVAENQPVGQVSADSASATVEEKAEVLSADEDKKTLEDIGSAPTLQDAIQAAQDKEEELKRFNSDVNKILNNENISKTPDK
jgi:putative ABC transport system ATP-binding protein